MKNHIRLAVWALGTLCVAPAAFAEPIALGDRLELFADEYLIAEIKGDLDRRLHQPEPKEVVFTADKPWEGNTSGYYTVFQDGDLYRMYYRGWAHDPDTKNKIRPELACYAESRDGITWTRPVLGLHEFEGSKENNIIATGPAAHNFTAFKDTNPQCAPEARYKALGRSGKGLLYFRSADGVRWERAQDAPVITAGAFDSQNLAYWDAHRGEYRAYWRIFTNKVRAIRTATSKDFVNWEPHHDLQYPEGTPNQHLYTNAIQPYFRAPHLFIGFPTRFLPTEDDRVEPVFMISRDGLNFLRYNDPVIPEDAPADRKGNRSNYMTWGLVTLPGKPGEMSVYGTEAYYGPVPGRVRRFAYRLDGFVSLSADADGGEALTKPLTFSGAKLIVNYRATQPEGSLRIELLTESGQPIEGFALADATPLTGDALEATAQWKNGADLSSLAGKTVRLRLALKNADLFSIQFRKQ
jgi:hypothetical protein